MALVCCLWLGVELACFGGDDQPPSPPVVEKLSKPKPVEKAPYPKELAPEKPPTGGDIRKLIASLAEVEAPYVGLSSTMYGRAFAAIAGTEKIDGGVLPVQRFKTPAPMIRLVQLGPQAVPYLLQALDDKTPSKLQVKAIFDFGLQKDRDPYTVKVGDICYVALGQIIGRPYQAVHYVPSGMMGITSPVEDKELAKKLRAEWANNDPAEKLRQDLIKDYQTKPVFNGKSLDGWEEGSDLQIEGAMRLLYYFPKQGVPLVVARLTALDVADPGKQLNAWMLREVRNGVRTDEFINAVAWCEHPDVRAALIKIAQRTTDPEIVKVLKSVGVSKPKP
jgi:hypothetical protein